MLHWHEAEEIMNVSLQYHIFITVLNSIAFCTLENVLYNPIKISLNVFFLTLIILFVTHTSTNTYLTYIILSLCQSLVIL